jgi:hypothetical protein
MIGLSIPAVALGQTAYTYTIEAKGLSGSSLVNLRAGTKFYPLVRDGYLDAVCLIDTLEPPAPFGYAQTVTVVQIATGKTVPALSFLRGDDWCWRGKKVSGERVPLGQYRLTAEAFVFDDETASTGTTVTSNAVVVEVATGYRTRLRNGTRTVPGEAVLMRDKTRGTFRGNCGFTSYSGVFCRPGSARPWYRVPTHRTTYKLRIDEVNGSCRWPSTEPRPTCNIAVRKDLPEAFLIGEFRGYGTFYLKSFSFTEWWKVKVRI